MNKLCAVLSLASIIGSAAGLSCESPKTSVMSYVASDAQVLTHAPFIAQFSLTCNGKAVNDPPSTTQTKLMEDSSRLPGPKTGLSTSWDGLLR